MRLGNKGLIAMEIMPGIEAETDIVQASDGLVTIADNATAMDKSILSTKLMGLKL
jgi:acyl CoA:acetate/3-ketoacid CoA transferase